MTYDSQPEDRKVRVRFAPSPTGPLHMGGVRTALFNYLFAKQNGGDFLLRIEDTDRTRYVPHAEEYIIESLKWCGLIPDEGVGFGGDCSPYRQSERKDIYQIYAKQLIESGYAYYAFDTPMELEALRAEAERQGQAFSYGPHNRHTLTNSLTLPPEVVNQKLAAGHAWVIRFMMPENRDVADHDLIRGEVTFNTGKLDDKVLFKADGMPTYHLANVVDDHLMRITHVIRGEEWLSSMPLHILLYETLGWSDTRPRFAHLPLILKPEGKGKLSKRDGDKMGFPVFPLQWTDPQTREVSKGYREEGYYPQAFINILALLGWSPGNDKEFFTIDELIESFSLDRVIKAGARFDPEKAKWFNRHYLQQQDDISLGAALKQQLEEKNIDCDDDQATRIVGLIKDRCTFAADLWEHSFYLFLAPESYDEAVVSKKWNPDTREKVEAIASFLGNLTDRDAAAIKEAFSGFINDRGWSFGEVMAPLRLALVGSSQGIDLFMIIELLGIKETVKRLEQAARKIS